ncbi:glycoside hydrolase family 15 protein [Paenibacillus cremeus]|uniref:Glycoside hydrolase family 15 protein n=1 Tax=Paenibacillus cremeus TaxID=2163881 RepID=A0A559KBX5_9BACL|nr:glycoside hydrolase family 15 protein [Paenibacillus cremeus]TVY09634.1 glycoside hydrolase family 15 protein [Paenibacillus cremeus]
MYDKRRLSIEDLVQASKQIIAWNQHPSGGYVACPLFTHYGFSWLRDGSFIAYGMDCVGETSSSGRFYEWCRTILERKADHITWLIDRQKRGEQIGRHEFLHTRYHLDGRDDLHSEWGNFQLDGYGAWLWGLAEHLERTGHTKLPEIYRKSVDVTVDYLCTFWQLPNFDCWEEHPEHVHPSTLACIYGGLSRIALLDDNAELANVCEEIHSFLMEHAIHPDGHIVKYITPVYEETGVRYDIGHSGVDASLFWLCEPFRVFPVEHPAMKQTLAKINRDLRTSHGGIRRYEEDTYYGGGEWPILTAWSGWVQSEAGNHEEAQRALAWIYSKADALGRLPEQVPDAIASRDIYEDWVQRWGTPAMPLLWSHAMFLVLYNRLIG